MLREPLLFMKRSCALAGRGYSRTSASVSKHSEDICCSTSSCSMFVPGKSDKFSATVAIRTSHYRHRISDTHLLRTVGVVGSEHSADMSPPQKGVQIVCDSPRLACTEQHPALTEPRHASSATQRPSVCNTTCAVV